MHFRVLAMYTTLFNYRATQDLIEMLITNLFYCCLKTPNWLDKLKRSLISEIKNCKCPFASFKRDRFLDYVFSKEPKESKNYIFIIIYILVKYL